MNVKHWNMHHTLNISPVLPFFFVFLCVSIVNAFGVKTKSKFQRHTSQIQWHDVWTLNLTWSSSLMAHASSSSSPILSSSNFLERASLSDSILSSRLWSCCRRNCTCSSYFFTSSSFSLSNPLSLNILFFGQIQTEWFFNYKVLMFIYLKSQILQL